jgi:conjugative relaxase-like TrwC/TraI family protein
MVTIQVCKDHGQAHSEYLSQADYFNLGQQVEGICCGELCEEVGLEQGAAISNDQFEAIAQNFHSCTGEQLTERMAAERRAGYDAVFSSPKSVSVQALVDDRLPGAHDRAWAATLPTLEQYACCQKGQGINKRYVPTGKIVGAAYRHSESRALDPQIHTHCFIFGVTWDVEKGRLVALETADIFEHAKYLSEVYRNHLAVEVGKLGYQIQKVEHGFELAGMPSALLERFSKRAKERDTAIAAREMKVGRKLTNKEISLLVHKNREKKLYELSPDEVRAYQLAQVTPEELAALKRLRVGTGHAPANQPSLVLAIERAKEHLFERQAVVDDHVLAAEVIRTSYGSFSVDQIDAAIVHGRHGLLVVDGRVTTQEAIVHERALIDQINAGIGRHATLGVPVESGLSQEQTTVVRQVLSSRDKAMVLRGKAGAGKSTTLAAIVEGCAAHGREVACFAPSTQAVKLLQRDGAKQKVSGCPAAGEALANTATVQRLLVDPTMQDNIAGKVLVIDEYGLLSTRDLKRILDLADHRGCRVLLVGDANQHTSIEASSAARLVERESRIAISELKEIHRQASNPGYLLAAKAFAAGETKEGLRLLDAMGAITEIPDPTERRAQMVDEWFAATFPKGKIKPQSTLMVAPTWVEIHAINDVARAKLRKAGKLTGEDREFCSLWAKDMTRAQKKDVTNYQPLDVLVIHKQTKQFDQGTILTVTERNKQRLTVRSANGDEFSVSPLQAGLSWTVCEERSIPVAMGDQVRLRAVGRCLTADGKKCRLANGTMLTVSGLDKAGRLVMPDGSVLLGYEVVHGYALTSHAAQGMTVDSVFIAGAITHEGLYVSSTRGRKSIRVFTPDRAAFLDAASLKSEDRMSALEFERYIQTQFSPQPVSSTKSFDRVRTALKQGSGFGRNMALDCLRSLQPWWLRLGQKAIRASLEAADSVSRGMDHE